MSPERSQVYQRLGHRRQLALGERAYNSYHRLSKLHIPEIPHLIRGIAGYFRVGSGNLLSNCASILGAPWREQIKQRGTIRIKRLAYGRIDVILVCRINTLHEGHNHFRLCKRYY